MRVLFILCALLAIAVTSLARPKDVDNTTEKTTTAAPLVTTIKNDSLNTTPALVGKSNDKLASTVAYTTPSVTTTVSQKDHTKSDITTVKESNVVTPISKNDSTTPTPTTTEASTTVKPTTTIEPTTIAPTTNVVTTAIPVTTVCPPSSERHFDGLSFLGGIILTICLIGVGVFLCKYCQNIHEDKYRTL